MSWKRILRPVPRSDQVLLGLDIGSGSVKVVALTWGPKGARLAAADQEAIPLHDEDSPLLDSKPSTAAAIRRLLERMQIEPRHVARLASSVGGANVTVGEFEMPRMKPRDLHKAIPWEARKHLPDDARVFDYEMLDDTAADTVRILLASLPQEQLEHHMDLLRAVDLQPERIEATPIALSLACSRLRRSAASDACVVLDIGRSGTTLVIGEESGPFFSRYLDIGLGSRAQALVTAGGEPHDESPTPPGGEAALVEEARRGEGPLLEELVLEVRRSMAFFGSHYNSSSIERLFVTGGGATHAPLVQTIGSQLGIPVTPFVYRGNQKVPLVEAPYAVAYGLAVRLGS
jgi:type IV pilus assembly protein PilM